MLNCAIIMGRLTADPELKTTANGVFVTSFCVAVDRNYSKGEKQTDFINVVAWRQTADFITRYFHKGDMIAVQGEIQTCNYEDRQGNKRTATEIVSNSVSFCGGKSTQGETKSTPQATIGNNRADIGIFHTPEDDDDDGLPF